MKIACVVLASGKSIRFKSPKTKVLYNVYGAPILEYTLKNITKYISNTSIKHKKDNHIKGFKKMIFNLSRKLRSFIFNDIIEIR